MGKYGKIGGGGFRMAMAGLWKYRIGVHGRIEAHRDKTSGLLRLHTMNCYIFEIILSVFTSLLLYNVV